MDAHYAAQTTASRNGCSTVEHSVVRTAGVGIYSAAVNANAVSQPSSLNQLSQLRFSFL